jgi:hypothetical protein
MSDIRLARRLDEGRSRRHEPQPSLDESRLEGVHAERERQRLIQREHARRNELSDDPDSGSNEWF